MSSDPRELAQRADEDEVKLFSEHIDYVMSEGEVGCPVCQRNVGHIHDADCWLGKLLKLETP